MKYVKTLEEFIGESNDYKRLMEIWNNELAAFLKDKSLGNLKIFNIDSLIPGVVNFSIKTIDDSLQLDWWISDQSTSNKRIIEIEVSSPNKKGIYSKKITGRNTTIEHIWKTITDIYNGKYSKIYEEYNNENIDESIDTRLRAKIFKELKSAGIEFNKDYKLSGSTFLANDLSIAYDMADALAGKFNVTIDDNRKLPEIPVMITK